VSSPIVSFVGKSNAGKTTLLEKLIPELMKRGYKVGTIKHDAHSFDIDHPGKDSWRHAQAGSLVAVISSPSRTAVVRRTDEEIGLDDIAETYMESVDIILTEGYRCEGKPKVEVLADRSGAPLSPPEELIMVVSDHRPSGVRVPVAGRDDIEAVADLLEKEVLNRRADTGRI
jgi:molybdopterin-guanine dinucleotide biosynthesis protein B